MLALLQRVKQAHVEIDGKTVGQIGAGLAVLVCAERGDNEAIAQRLLAKILKLRIFSDDEAIAGPPQDGRSAPLGGGEPHAVGSLGAVRPGKMNRSVQDVDRKGGMGGLRYPCAWSQTFDSGYGDCSDSFTHTI